MLSRLDKKIIEFEARKKAWLETYRLLENGEGLPLYKLEEYERINVELNRLRALRGDK
jgi:hypothetical protein